MLNAGIRIRFSQADFIISATEGLFIASLSISESPQ